MEMKSLSYRWFQEDKNNLINITEKEIPTNKLYAELNDLTCGGIVTFEGRIRNHNHGKEVTALNYECYKPMSIKVLEDITKQAKTKWNLNKAIAVHRIGNIQIGEIAVWVGVASHHRNQAFEACRFIIDEIKTKAPIWKHETYSDGTKEWIEGCRH